MNITADTNVLIRSVVQDDLRQAASADRLLRKAELIAVTLPCLCEFAWVLDRLYGFKRHDIATAIRALLHARSVVVDRPGAAAGLAVLEAGGDFADGVIAYEGAKLGGDTFVSFDKQAVKLLQNSGASARLP